MLHVVDFLCTDYVFISVTGNMLGNVMLLLLRCEEFEKASTVLEKLDLQHHTIPGVPSLEALSYYVESCVNRKLPSAAIVSKNKLHPDKYLITPFFRDASSIRQIVVSLKQYL